MFRSGCDWGVQARERGARRGSGCQPCGERVPVSRGQPIGSIIGTGLQMHENRPFGRLRSQLDQAPTAQLLVGGVRYTNRSESDCSAAATRAIKARFPSFDSPRSPASANHVRLAPPDCRDGRGPASDQLPGGPSASPLDCTLPARMFDECSRALICRNRQRGDRTQCPVTPPGRSQCQVRGGVLVGACPRSCRS